MNRFSLSFISRSLVVVAITAFFVSTAATAFADTIVSDGFGTGATDSSFDESPAWTEGGAGAEKRAAGSGGDSASPNGDRFAVVFGSNGTICRSINTTGYTSVQLSYYWRGDSDANNSSDDGIVEFKVGSCSDSSGWTQLQNHDMQSDGSWSTQTAFTNAGFNNTTFVLRFRTNTNQSDEHFRVDGVSITGTPLVSNQTITVGTHAPASATYDGTFSVAATASSGLPVAITVEGGCSIDAGTVTMTSGTTDCVVKYNQAGNASWNAAPEVTETVDAQKADATITVTGFNGVYDGAQHGASGSATGVNGEDLSSSLNLGSTFKNVPGGNANWIFTGDANYNDDSGSAAVTITKQDIEVTILPSDKVYDGTTGNPAPNYQYIVYITDHVFVDYATSNFDTADVGTDKTVTVTGIFLHGNDIGNYNLLNTTATGLADITPRAITITADAQSKVFGDVEPALTYASTGELVAPDAFTGALTRAVGEDAGVYAITQGDLALTSNYAITFNGADFTITPADGDIALSGLEHTYDGTPKEATVTSTLTYDVTYDALPDLPVNAGDYAVVATITDANHSGSASDTLTIAPAAIEVTIDNASKAFGAADPEFTYTVSGGAFVGEDTFTTATLSREAGEALGTYAITGEFDAGGNYVVTVIDGTFTISTDPNNAAPTAANQNLTIEQDSSTPVTLVANDPESTPVTWNVGEPANGVLSGDAPNLTYTPNSGFFGEDSFTFSANDGNSDSANATVNITVQMLATCPAGFSFVGTDCVADGPIEACEAGYEYDGTNCVPEPQTPTCPNDGSVGNVDTGECDYPNQIPSCPAGFMINPVPGDTENLCISVSDPFDTTTHTPTCEEGYTLNEALHQCVKPSISACEAGFVYDRDSEMCVTDGSDVQSPACPSGTTGTVEGGECTPDNTAPSCPSGYERDGRVCIAVEVEEPLTCDDGFHVEGDQCVADEVVEQEQNENENQNENNNSNTNSNNNSNSSGGGGGGGSGRTVTSPATTTPGQILGAATSCYQFTRYLARGMSGDDVTELQKILIGKGYMSVAANGHFGPATEAGVKAFQKANGLEQVGAVGPLTRALLNKCGQTGGTNPNQALIDELLKKLNALLEQIKTLQAAQQN